MEGTTLLVTTHYMDEAEYCNTLVLMHAGRIVAQGSPRQLKSEVITGVVFEIECTDPVAAMAALKSSPAVRESALFATRLHVSLDREEEAPAVVAAVRAAGIEVIRYARIVPSLEDVFIRLIDAQGQAQG